MDGLDVRPVAQGYFGFFYDASQDFSEGSHLVRGKGSMLLNCKRENCPSRSKRGTGS